MEDFYEKPSRIVNKRKHSYTKVKQDFDGPRIKQSPKKEKGKQHRVWLLSKSDDYFDN